MITMGEVWMQKESLCFHLDIDVTLSIDTTALACSFLKCCTPWLTPDMTPVIHHPYGSQLAAAYPQASSNFPDRRK